MNNKIHNYSFPKARIGFICVANAGLTEGDMFAMRPNNVALNFTRVKMQSQCTVANLGAMGNELDNAIDTLMPDRTDLDVICYNCTAGSFIIGEEVIRAKITSKHSSAMATTLLSGVTAAFKALNVHRIAIATAYTDDINMLEKTYFESLGYEVIKIQGLGLIHDAEMNRLTPEALAAFVETTDHPDADCVFISCGALHSTPIIEYLETRLNKPVIGSNQASMWHCLRLAKINKKITGFGHLLFKH